MKWRSTGPAIGRLVCSSVRMSFHKARQWEEGAAAVPRPGFQLWFGTNLHNLEKGRGLMAGKNRSHLYFGLGVFGVKGQKGLKWLPLRRWPRTPSFLFMVNVAAAKAVGGRGERGNETGENQVDIDILWSRDGWFLVSFHQAFAGFPEAFFSLCIFKAIFQSLL